MQDIKHQLDRDNFPELDSANALAAVQAPLLKCHPYWNIGHGMFDMRTGKMVESKLGPADLGMSRQEVIDQNQYFRDEISKQFIQTTSRVIDLLAEELQLEPIHKELPPTIICSDVIDQKDASSAGMDDGFYPVRGSFFVCNQIIPQRIDYRLRYHLGPIIHYDLSDVDYQDMDVFVEESLHYLQWLHESSPEAIDRVLGWRVINERDETRREAALQALEKRELDFPFDYHERESGLLIAGEPAWASGKGPYGIKDFREPINPTKSQEETLASLIIYECVAELLRIRFEVSESPAPFIHLENWCARGIGGWTNSKQTDELEDYSVSVAEIQNCYDSFKELSFEAYAAELETRNGLSLEELRQLSQVVSQTSGGDFPGQLGHFLGHTLAHELTHHEDFNGLAGLQEISFRFFSYQLNAVERLETIKQLVE